LGLDDSLPPAVSEATAARLARELYDLAASATALPGEHDHNFALNTSSGERLVLKVMHPARERSLVDLQAAALAHLEQSAPELAVPRVRPTRAGDVVAPAEVEGGPPRLVWLLTHLPGRPLAEARPRTPRLLADLGRLLGRLDAALADFDHPGARRELKWDLGRAGWIRAHLGAIEDPGRRALVEGALDRYEAEVVPALPGLRRGVIHNDANDWNVVVGDARSSPRPVGLIDFADTLHTVTAAEPAIAAAYALMGQGDPLAAASAVVAGYHEAHPLAPEEIAVLFPLIETRLAVSVTNAALMAARRPGDRYVRISEVPAWAALEALARIPPRLAHYALRNACGLPPVPGAADVVAWLRERAASAAPVLEHDLRATPCVVFDLSVGSVFLGADPQNARTGPLTRRLLAEMGRAGVPVGVGRYGEVRGLYTAPAFAAGGGPLDERRTVHLGVDLFVAAGSAVHAPLDGTVHLVADNDAPQDYGPLVVLRHDAGGGRSLFTLYGHLGEECLTVLRVGDEVKAGQVIATVGAPPANGDWPPHLHFQVILDLLDLGAAFPGVTRPGQAAVFRALSPDPSVIVGIPAERQAAAAPAAVEETLAARCRLLGPSLRLSYAAPLKIVRGWRQFLYDETGRAYLDVYNNVPLVGHSHPRVVRAAAEQLALLNTNTRYLHDRVLEYGERLRRLLPEPLGVFFFLSSGSEANELALRLARTHTGRQDVVVLEHAYHGHTGGLVDVSPYKFDGPGGRGRRPFVHVAPLPDDYRGRYRRDDPERGPKYARHVAEIVEEMAARGAGPAAFLAESMPSTAGQIVLPPGYLTEAYRVVRAAGGLCIADEVQVGFGRLGSAFWGFETQGVVPDVVVLGKPIGNGFPLAAVATTAEVARSFDNGMEFFSTFGGNPVAAAVGLAVLDVLEEERLPDNARRVGEHLEARLTALQDRHPVVGDVRGMGLFLGVELVRDRRTLEPATAEAHHVVNRLRERGVLTGTDGPFANVLKIRPPLCLTMEDADLFVGLLADVLSDDMVREGGRPPGVE
jgi:4-aminobutyrate aminotransferase-like enzyme/Ser/Thr protein kinase RdoA (MazF antagonist)